MSENESVPSEASAPAESVTEARADGKVEVAVGATGDGKLDGAGKLDGTGKHGKGNAKVFPEPAPLPFKNWPFNAFLATQFLGAFNDNVFKQAVLLLAVAAYVQGVVAMNFQAIVQAAFALPFLLVSGVAGDLSDRYSKGGMMLWCKVAEIVVMVAGIAAFAMGATDAAMWALVTLAAIMGTQSAFFGPPKYGGMPELVKHGDVAPASGLTQLTTFLAIIFGIAWSGVLVRDLGGVDRAVSQGDVDMWIIGVICTVLAVLGTVTALGIWRKPATDPSRKINLASTWAVFPVLWRMVKRDRLLMYVVVAYAFFWGLGGMMLTLLNEYGKRQLRLDDADTSLLVATISLGIGIGSAVGGRLSRGRVRLGLTVPGALGLVVGLVLLAAVPVAEPLAPDEPSAPAKTETRSAARDDALTHSVAPAHAGTAAADEAAPAGGDGAGRPALLEAVGGDGVADDAPAEPLVPESSKYWAYAVLFLLGAAGGFYSVPLLAFVQLRPPESDRGRVFAAVNWFNWLFILGSAFLFFGTMQLAHDYTNIIFAWLSIAMLVVTVVVLPPIFRLAKKEHVSFVSVGLDDTPA